MGTLTMYYRIEMDGRINRRRWTGAAPWGWHTTVKKAKRFRIVDLKALIKMHQTELKKVMRIKDGTK